MKKIGIVGHYGGGNEFLDGQTVKTKIITKQLIEHYGKEQIQRIDTYGGKTKIVNKIISVVGLLRVCDSVIILPAQNSVRVFAPVIVTANRVCKRKLHYIVIGGWIPEFVSKRKWLLKCLKKFDYIYVETSTMKRKMEEIGLNNVVVLPNCKDLKIIAENELSCSNRKPFKLCTFSRVMKEKGIEEAVKAVERINKQQDETLFSLDIYGQIDTNQCEWFKELEKEFPEYICYKGVVPFEKSTDILKNYTALLFPTYYEGEGFAGTLIDAMAAGVPVIASDWRYNAEIVKDYETGLIIKAGESIEEKLSWILSNKEQWDIMKKKSLKEIKRYLPENALKKLFLCLE